MRLVLAAVVCRPWRCCGRCCCSWFCCSLKSCSARCLARAATSAVARGCGSSARAGATRRLPAIAA
eukprot:402555-Lingulodinium_polyedra.AAC.1